MPNNPKVIMYHGVIPKQKGYTSESLRVVYQEDFERQLKWLKKIYSIISPQEFYLYLTNAKYKLPKRSLLITFDDGFKNIFDYALPIAEKLKISILVFCCSQNIEYRKWLWFSRLTCAELRGNSNVKEFQHNYKNLSYSEIESGLQNLEAPSFEKGSELEHILFDGISPQELKEHAKNPFLEIGGHSINHPRLTNETNHTVNNEIEENKHYLEKIIGNKVRFFAYPEGEANESIAQAVQKAGYKAAFSVGNIDTSLSLKRFVIPRIGLYRAGIMYTSLKLILNRH